MDVFYRQFDHLELISVSLTGPLQTNQGTNGYQAIADAMIVSVDYKKPLITGISSF